MRSGFHDHDERRRAPRFHCGGQVSIRSLPSYGVPVLGKVRDLSLGGLCVESSDEIEAGTRIEILTQINAICFRAAALVKVKQTPLVVGLEFSRMSTGSHRALEDLVARLTKIQLAVRALRSASAGGDDCIEQELRETRARSVIQEILTGLTPNAVDEMLPPQATTLSTDAVSNKGTSGKPIDLSLIPATIDVVC